jgi:hypothetical protein
MDRRKLLTQMAALGLAVPAMDLDRHTTYFFGPWLPEQPPKLWGDSVHDDAVALQWYLDHGKQIPNGIYASTNRDLRLQSGEHISRAYAWPFRRVDGPTTTAFIRDTPADWGEWRWPEAAQKQYLAWEATRLRQRKEQLRMGLIAAATAGRRQGRAQSVLSASTEEINEKCMKLGVTLTPEEVRDRARVMAAQSIEALMNVPSVDYSELTIEQAREALYRTIVEADAAGAARRVRIRARYQET